MVMFLFDTRVLVSGRSGTSSELEILRRLRLRRSVVSCSISAPGLLERVRAARQFSRKEVGGLMK